MVEYHLSWIKAEELADLKDVSPFHLWNCKFIKLHNIASLSTINTNKENVIMAIKWILRLHLKVKFSNQKDYVNDAKQKIFQQI